MSAYIALYPFSELPITNYLLGCKIISLYVHLTAEARTHLENPSVELEPLLSGVREWVIVIISKIKKQTNKIGVLACSEAIENILNPQTKISVSSVTIIPSNLTFLWKKK